jgi:hypothetical protein
MMSVNPEDRIIGDALSAGRIDLGDDPDGDNTPDPDLLTALGLPGLVEEFAVIDPDCRAGKHASCTTGGLCQCPKHSDPDMLCWAEQHARDLAEAEQDDASQVPADEREAALAAWAVANGEAEAEEPEVIQEHWEIFPTSGAGAWDTKATPVCYTIEGAFHNARQYSKDGAGYVVEHVAPVTGERTRVAEFINGRKVRQP